MIAKGNAISDYRYDIDGLRALAVLPVVLFHAGFTSIPGGFVGVDIFFVISGYLITRIIYNEVRTERFSIVKFYERRAKRIMPALLTVVLFSILLSWLFFLPKHLDATLKSSIATLLFSSNMWFWQSSLEYFGPAVELAPLLHTWSLAVEEQYYIFFPLILMFLHRYAPGKINIAILLITVVSFILSAIAVEVKPSATFYILPTRAWELGLGAILAVYPGLSKLGYKASLVLNVLGAVLITIALFFIDEQTTFPGPAALLPCLGAMFLIASGGTYSNLPTSYILETKPAVFIGKISYSLYLWHWPVIVFTKYLSSNTSLTLGLALLSIVLSLILSVFSWKYIETPFRSKGISRQFIFRLSGVSMAILLAIALSVLNFNFLKIPLSDLQTQIVNVARDRVADREENCEAIDDFGNVCAIGQIRKPSHYDFLLFGDSHAEAISEAFSLAAAQAGVSGLATNVNCPPLLGVNRKIAPECTHFVASVIKGLENRDDIKTVILHGRWAQLDTGKFMPGEAKNHNDALSVVEDAYHEITGSTHEVFKVGIARTVEAILATGRKVIIIESVPEVGWNVPYATLMENRWHIPKPAPPTITSFTERQAGVFDAFKPLRDMPNVRFYAPADYLCTPDCIVELEGLPAYFDDDHLSNHAAQILLKDLINDALANL